MGRIRKDFVAMKAARAAVPHNIHGHSRLRQLFLCPYCGNAASTGTNSMRTPTVGRYVSRRQCDGCDLVWDQMSEVHEGSGPARVVRVMKADGPFPEEDQPW